MQKWSFYFSYALKSLRRGGQRVLIALLCIAFGVMSLVSMQNLAGSISQVMLAEPRNRIGGDAIVSRSENFLSAEQLTIFEKLRTEGKIQKFTAVASSSELMVRLPDSGKVTFINEGLGIDPLVYPLYGQFELSNKTTLAEAIREAGSAGVTQDIADQLGLKPGDKFILTSRFNSVPSALRVGGIIEKTPNNIGSRIFYSLETARRLNGNQQGLTEVLVSWANPAGSVRSELTTAGWIISDANEQSATDKKIAEVFDFMLKGAGILGLLVGGIGVANTMLVLLAGRRNEIAILKTLGAPRRKLFVLLGLETLILGAGGSLVGLAIAMALSNGLVYLFSQSSALLLKWSFDPWLGISGLAAGTFTTLVFGMFAIVRASEVRPMSLLRQMAVKIQPGQTAFLVGLLAVMFLGIASFILNSLWNGLLILLIASVGLLVVGGGLGLLLWLALKILPTFQFYLLKLARRNLSRKLLTNLFAMVALFLGIFSLTFAAAVITSSQEQLDLRSLSQTGYNLAVTGASEQETTISNALATQKLAAGNIRYEVLPKNIRPLDGSAETDFLGLTLQGRAALWDIKPETQPNWAANPTAIYVPERLSQLKGTKLVITGVSGVQETVTVAGTYQPVDFQTALIATTRGLVMSKELALKLGGSQTHLTFAVQVPVDQLVQSGERLGKLLPQTMVITLAELNAYFTQRLRSLFWFAVAMAGLAILAGAVLVANTVGLAMVERQREIGVLKAVGYTSRHVLKTVLLEYSLLAGIAGICAVIATQIVMWLLTVQTGGLLKLDILIALEGIGTGLLITLATVWLAAWRPLQVRPIVILNR